jgi:two-component system chemotaxis sensor kinase CheA
MPANDEEFLEKLRAAFTLEADEHLQAMSAGLLDLEKNPGNGSLIEVIYREAHSLKGAARAVNITAIETICQSLETVFAAWKSKQTTPAPEAFDRLYRSIDDIQRLLAPDELPTGERKEPVVSGRRLNVAATEKTREPAFSAAESHGLPPVEKSSAVPDTVRISTAKLDSVLLKSEEMLTMNLRANHRTAGLREAQLSMARWKKEWSKVQPELRALRQGLAGKSAPMRPEKLIEFLDWDQRQLARLESEVAALAASAAADSRGAGTMIHTLLDETKKLLMLPFATLTGGFPRLVRDLSRDQGKEVDLIIDGAQVEIDKRILEELKDPLIHLLRNSVDHGIDTPEERVRLGKPRRATVHLSFAQVGGKIEVRVADDGAGIDIESVRRSAVQHGVVSSDEASRLDHQEALNLIFESEISTTPIITEISGRGLGLAIVREKVEKFGGRVEVENKAPHGAIFHLMLPLTLAIFRGILVEASDQTFVIPTSNVRCVRRVKREEIKTVENKETISIESSVLPFVRLDELLELPRGANANTDGGPLQMLVLSSGTARIALQVDAIFAEQEVLVKALRKPLVRVRNVVGATILGSGKPAPILNTADLFKSAAKLKTSFKAKDVPKETRAAKPILLVEDSITSRMLLKNILESAGYEVTTAVDGLDAATAVKTKKFALLVSDVDMPRMNGFELAAKIRGDEKTGKMPIVLVTARESREDRERGIDVGANAYIVKSSFDQSNLIEVIRQLI